MNYRILFGSACVNREFAALLLSDPLAAAQQLGLTLTPEERTDLVPRMEEGQVNGLEGAFNAAMERICPPKGVCPTWIKNFPYSGSELRAS